MRLSNPYFALLCMSRFVEHFTNSGLDQKTYDGNRVAPLRERLAARAYKGIASRHADGHLLPVEVATQDAFIAAAARRDSPVVFRRGAADWPCSSKWNVEYFKDRCSKTEVFTISDHITETGSVRGRTSLGDVIGAFGSGSQYARFVPIIHTFPQVLQDLDMAFCSAVIGRGRRPVKVWGDKGKGVSIRSHLFIGEEGTKTNTHCELTNNLFFNVVGRKEWIVCPPAYMFALRSPVTKNPGVFGSRYLADGAHQQGFSLAERLPKYRILMEPGDILYLPPFYWHEVRNRSKNISLGLRWYAFADGMLSSRTLNLLSLLATRPSMLKAIRNATEYGKVHGDN